MENKQSPLPLKSFQECPVKHHDTIVIGWNENREVVYVRTFDYVADPIQAAEAQVAFKWCIDNCASWRIGTTEKLNISPRDKDEEE